MDRKSRLKLRKDDVVDEKLKPTRGEVTRGGTGLTCNEASVDCLLSEGEST
jgi:hypothetical protein